MANSKVELNNENSINSGFKINMYFNKDGQTLQKVMEKGLIIYYEKATYSK